MDGLRLVSPELKHKEKFEEMAAEWAEAGGKIYPGSLRRAEGVTYERLLELIDMDRHEHTCPPGKVPQELYFLADEDENLLGAISIRRWLNDELLQTGGHIGYGIRPSQRGKGYGKAQLLLALNVCRALGLNRALITCNSDNAASEGVILACGGVFENEVPDKGESTIFRYWIDLPKNANCKIEFAVKGLIFYEGRYLALHKAKKRTDKLELPGGRTEFGETAEQTLVREVFEETGLTVKPIRLLDTFNAMVYEALQVTGIIYLCEVEKGSFDITLSAEHDGFRWLDAGYIEAMEDAYRKRMEKWDWAVVAANA